MLWSATVNVIARRTLVAFWTRRSEAKSAVSSWYAVVRKASWGSFADVKATFNSADAVGGGKVVFDIGGYNYRLVGLVGYRSKRVYILWVGTHAEYDKIDVAEL
jgi:mRNA interferase HigB